MLLDGDLSLSFFAAFENDVLESDVFTLLDSDAGLTGAFDNVASGGAPAPNPRAVFLALAGFVTITISLAVVIWRLSEHRAKAV